ncbi:MAG TPA: AsmA family protein [Longimicrobiales bacterium]|nr:AsmA family protein [Longimicrobiales bacterium]
MRRRIIYIAGFAALLLLVLPLALLLLIPAERAGIMVAARAEAALDRDVTVGGFRVKLLPRPAIALDNVVVGGPRETPQPVSALASARRVELRPRLLPLLRRNVIVDEVRVDRLRVLIDIDAEGNSNLPQIDDAEAGEPAEDLELRIRRLQLTDGRIGYRDARDGTIVRVDGIEQALRVSGSLSAGELSRAALSGVLEIADIDAILPGRLAWPLQDVRLRLDHDLTLDRAADRLDVTALELRLQELPIRVAGTIAALGNDERRTVDLTLGTGSVDVARLVASLPRALLEGASGDVIEGAAGYATLDAVVQGRAGAGEVPAVTGTLAIADAALDRGRHGRIVDGLSGALAFSLDSVSTTGITGRLLGEPFQLAATIHDFSAPRGTVAVRSALTMAEAGKLGLLPEGSEATGRIGFDIRAEGPFTQLAQVLVDGHLDVTGITLQVPALEQPAVVDEGRIVFAGGTAATSGLRAHVGNSDVELDFDAADWLPYALGDTTHVPVVTFDARSARFDADEIFGIDQDRYTYGQLFFARLAGDELDGRTPADLAEEMGLGLPTVPPIRMDGHVRARQLVNGGVAFDDVDVVVAARDGTLEVQAASFRMMGGGVHLNGRLGLAAPGAAYAAQPLELDYTVNSVGAQPFLERFTAFRDHVTGELLLNGSVRMSLDDHLLPVTETVAGAGTLALMDGEIVNWPLLRAVGERIGVARFDTLAFTDWTGRYTLAGSRVVLDESVLQGRDLQVRAAGSFDFAGNLDMGATLYMPQQWAQRIPGAPTAFLVNLVSGADGTVPVGARLTGNVRAPSVRLDLSEAGARTASAVREAARQEAREVATRVLDDVTDRLPTRDSLAARADSARSAVQDSITSRLRRIIRPGGG